MPLKILGGVVALGACAFGGATLASGASSSARDTTTATTTTATAPTAPARTPETPLTGDVLTKAEAAAVAKTGGTADSATTETDSSLTGAAYEVHVTKADGTHVTVILDTSDNVLGLETGGPGGRGPGGPDGHGGPPPGQGNGNDDGGGGSSSGSNGGTAEIAGFFRAE